MKSHILLLSDLGSFLNTLESSVYVLSILTIPNQHQLAMKYEEFRLPFVHLLPADIVDKPSQLRIVQQLQPLSLPPFFYLISYWNSCDEASPNGGPSRTPKNARTGQPKFRPTESTETNIPLASQNDNNTIMVRNVLSQERCATNLKQSRVALIVGVPIAISITTIILYSLWSIQGTVAHVAGCGSHLIAGLDALQRYQGDTNGILNGIGSKLNGLQAQDRQSFVTGYQYLRDNCVNTINALQGFYFYFCF